MSLAQIITRLFAAGFQFSLDSDGGVSFRCPSTDTPEVDEAKGLLAWRWNELECAIRERLTTQQEIHQ